MVCPDALHVPQLMPTVSPFRPAAPRLASLRLTSPHLPAPASCCPYPVHHSFVSRSTSRVQTIRQAGRQASKQLASRATPNHTPCACQRYEAPIPLPSRAPGSLRRRRRPIPRRPFRHVIFQPACPPASLQDPVVRPALGREQTTCQPDRYSRSMCSVRVHHTLACPACPWR